MTDCINLRERFGDKYRVTYEESYYAEHGDHGRADDPWLLIIPCDRGHIGPYGGTRLFASTNTARGQAAKALRSLPCCQVWQDGDDGLNVTFDVADFAQVAAIMRPKRRRRLSPERRAALVEAGKANRFLSASRGVHCDSSERQRIPADLDDSEHQPTDPKRSGAQKSGLSRERTTKPARASRTGGKPAPSSHDEQRRESA